MASLSPSAASACSVRLRSAIESCGTRVLPTEGVAALNHPNQDDDDGHDQEDVDEPSQRVRRHHAKEPEDKQDDQEGREHEGLDRILGSGVANRLCCCEHLCPG